MAKKMEKKLTRAAIRDRREDIEAEIDCWESELFELQRDCPHPVTALRDGFCEDCGDVLNHEEIEERLEARRAKRRKSRKKRKAK